MTIIADAGSSKTQWALCLDDGRSIILPPIEGFNPVTSSEETATQRISGARKMILEACPQAANPEMVFYYGAGCATPQICHRISCILEAIFHFPAEAHSDMLGAARSLLGNHPGVACILGTGSNSALYDGAEIIMNTPPLGYILGDEGGGAAIGKRLLADIFKGLAPDEIRNVFFKKHDLDKATLIEKVYRTPEANRWLASFAPFVKENISHPYLDGMVTTLFEDFFMRNLSQYPNARQLPVSFTGSVAANFGTQLRAAGAKLGFTVAEVTKSPIEGIIRYHNQ